MVNGQCYIRYITFFSKPSLSAGKQNIFRQRLMHFDTSYFFSLSINGLSISIGTGKMVVVLCSEEISTKVCK